MSNQSVIVIGAGIVGCSLASELVRRGWTVTLIDAAAVGTATTGATFGRVNSGDKEPLDYHLLNLRGLEAHVRQSARRGGDAWFHPTGNLEIATSEYGLHALEARVDRLREKSYPAQVLTVAQAQELEPSVDFRKASGAGYFPQEGWADVEAACAEMLAEVRQAGGTFAPFQRVVSIERPGVVEAVDTVGETSTFTADTVVLAAGNGTQALAATAGVTIPMHPGGTRQQSPAASIGAAAAYDAAGFATDQSAVSHPTVGLTCTTSPVIDGPRRMLRLPGVALRPARNGGVMLTDGSTASQWGIDDERLMTVPRELLARARAMVPALDDAFISGVAVADRVLPADGLTISDWLRDDRRTYVITTHSGVTLAPYLAEVVADEIVTGSRPDALVPFGLDRFE